MATRSGIERIGSSATPCAAFGGGVPTWSMRHGAATWAAGSRHPMLYHDWDVLWARRGSIAMAVRSGPELVVAADGFVILPPFVPVVLRPLDGDADVGFCHFAFRLPSPDVPAKLAEDFRGPDGAPLPLAFSGRDAPEVLRAYKALLALPPPRADRPWRVERAVIGLVAALAAFAADGAERRRGDIMAPPRVDPRLERVRARIEQHPERPWRVAALAREVGLSPSRLHRLHADVFGISLKRHLIELRLRPALNLLRDTSLGRPMPVHVVAERCGFSSAAFFSRQFRSVFHQSPAQYRRGHALG